LGARGCRRSKRWSRWPTTDSSRCRMLGGQIVSPSHVDNVVECLLLAAEKGRGGEAYYVPDGEDSTLKGVMNALLGTCGVPPIKRSVPFGVAWLMATVMESVWRLFRLRSKPPVTRQTLRMIGRTSPSTSLRHAATSVTYRSSTGLKVSRGSARASSSRRGYAIGATSGLVSQQLCLAMRNLSRIHHLACHCH
jgi:hypothetical protein